MLECVTIVSWRKSIVEVSQSGDYSRVFARIVREAEMFSLINGLVQYLFKRAEYFILIVGLDNAGKTCLLEKFKTVHKPTYKAQPPEKISSTVGLNVGRVDIGSLRLVFWDLGGQLDLQCLWEKYYKEVHGVIYVIDSTDKERLRDSKDAFDQMVEDRSLQGVPLLVLANKQDVEGALTIPEIKAVFNESAPKLGVRDCKVQNVSAITGQNIKAALEWMSNSVERNHARPPAGQEFY